MNVAMFTDNDCTKLNDMTATLRAVVEHAPADMRVRVYTCQEHGCDTPACLATAARGMGIPYCAEMKMYVPPLRHFARAAAEDRIDVIHLTTPGPVGLAALYVASRTRKPLVGSFHTDLAACTRVLSGSPALGRLMQAYIRWPYGKCERVLVPSGVTRDLLAASGLSDGRTRIWRCGVNAQRYCPDKRSGSLRSAWGVSEMRPALLYVGRLSAEKGIPLLRQLAAGLKLTGLSYRWIIAGEGPMRAELTECFPDAVFTGALEPDDAATAMASADALVFPSRTDTAGAVVLEAQASGLPVLVSDAGGAREDLVDGRTGFVCRDLAAFTIRSHALLSDGAQRRTLGREARVYAESRSWPHALEPLFDTWRDVGRRPVSHVPRRGWHTAGQPAALVRHARLRSVPSIFQG